MSVSGEFREFIMRGNVVDLAVGVVIGAAFGRIVSVLVERIIMPPIGLLIGGVDFSELVIVLSRATAEAEAVTIGIGEFINALIQFLIVAAAIFMVVRTLNRLQRRQAREQVPPPPAGPSEEVQLLREIRDRLQPR